jgi:hypothetical protein
MAVAATPLRFVEGRSALGTGSTSHGVQTRSFYPNQFGLNLYLLTLFHPTSLVILQLAVFPVIQAISHGQMWQQQEATCGSTGSTRVALNPLTVLVTQVSFAQQSSSLSCPHTCICI